MTTYLTIRGDLLSADARAVLEAGDCIDDATLAELERVGERVADPEAYLASESVDGWYLDEDGHSHYVRGLIPDGTVRYTVSDGVEGYTVDATSPREAVERYLETYDWRRDLDAEYGDRGLAIDGAVSVGGKLVAHFRATPDGIARFIEF